MISYRNRICHDGREAREGAAEEHSDRKIRLLGTAYNGIRGKDRPPQQERTLFRECNIRLPESDIARNVQCE